MYGLGRASFFWGFPGSARALSTDGRGCCPGRTGRGIGFMATSVRPPSCAARGARWLTLGTSKWSSGRPRGGLQIGGTSDAAFEDSTETTFCESLEVSSLRREPPLLDGSPYLPSTTSGPSNDTSARESIFRLDGDEGAEGLWRRLALSDLGGGRWPTLGLAVMIVPFPGAGL